MITDELIESINGCTILLSGKELDDDQRQTLLSYDNEALVEVAGTYNYYAELRRLELC